MSRTCDGRGLLVIDPVRQSGGGDPITTRCPGCDRCRPPVGTIEWARGVIARALALPPPDGDDRPADENSPRPKDLS